jgi:hypothetical protein
MGYLVESAASLDGFSKGKDIEVLATFPDAVLPRGKRRLIHDLSGFHIPLCRGSYGPYRMSLFLVLKSGFGSGS